MIAHIRDKLALEAISPSALRAYVLYEGWKRAEAFGQWSEVYTRAQDHKNELIIPVSTTIADYAAAVSEALKFLSKIEDRDELAIYRDLVRADRDVIRIRAIEAGDDGSIQIEHGVELVQNARNMLASSACSAFDPRRSYHLGKVQQAAEYMNRVRLGQTEHGSFVVTMLAPMPPSLSDPRQATFWPDMDEEPYERQVTRFLAQGLRSAHDAVVDSNRGEGLAAFIRAVPLGLSANLCEAVSNIVEQTSHAEISVTWARTRPTPNAREQIVFDRTEGEVLREVARQFRLREPRHDERVIGYVTDLHRSQADFEGRVTIKAIVDGKARALTTTLVPLDYRLAITANESRLPVTLIGDLELEGQRWRLIEPRELRIVEDEDKL